MTDQTWVEDGILTVRADADSVDLVTATGGSTARTLAAWFEHIGRGTEEPTLGNYWSDEGSFSPWRSSTRIFVDDAIEIAGVKSPSLSAQKTWVGNQNNGLMTYFETRSSVATFSSRGFVGGAFASRSSDNTETGEDGTIGVGAYALNDNTNAADKKAVWAFYGHAAQTVANQFTHGLEVDVTNLVNDSIELNPYSMATVGGSATAWFGVGGETAQGLVAAADTTSQKPVSVALGIVNTAPTATSNRYRKGIAFQSTSLLRTTPGDETTVAHAMSLARGHQLEWTFDDTGVVSGFIRGDASAATNGIVFNNAGVEVRDNGNLLQAQFAHVASVANYFKFLPAAAAGTPVLSVLGTDTDIDLSLAGKGNGRINIVQGAGTASVAANFSASRYFAIKLAGTQYIVPCHTTTW